ncbi:MAG: hypothetical protein HY903_09240 [Deltaproteobacteria bacterium]|nr:hypothetical protein [Deltaproteobacteria bacterium]
MKPSTIQVVCTVAGLALAALLVGVWVHGAAARVEATRATPAEKTAAVAAAADEGYCTAELKKILKRVLTSCGLVHRDRGRGCQPLEAKSVAAMSGNDFNALFRPLAKRAGIVQFDLDKAELDDAGRTLLDQTFSDQRGASYFLVVSRASPEGSMTHNRALSEQRAEAVLGYLKDKYHDPDLEQEVGLLWLGEEYAQLDQEFSQWNRSRAGAACTSAELNRSAFLAWIDCRL